MVQANQKYRHFKGNIYTILAVGKSSETLEDMVVYQDDEHIWIRPLAMFEEEVEVEGKRVPRFQRIED